MYPKEFILHIKTLVFFLYLYSAGFWKDLNGFTQLLIMLGTLSDKGPGDLSVHFLDCTGDTLRAWKSVKLRESYLLAPHIAYGGLKDVLHGSGTTRFTHKLVGSDAATHTDIANGSAEMENLRGPSLKPGNAIGKAVNNSLFAKDNTGKSLNPGVSTASCAEYLGTVGGYWPAIDVSYLVLYIRIVV